MRNIAQTHEDAKRRMQLIEASKQDLLKVEWNNRRKSYNGKEEYNKCKRNLHLNQIVPSALP